MNAVLRKAAATKGTLQEPVSYADRYSHPDELISLLKGQPAQRASWNPCSLPTTPRPGRWCR